MADYSTEKGFTIQSLASDPYASEVLGGTWAAGGALNTPRAKGGGLGIQTAAMYAGGVPAVGVSETYDGTSWTEGNNITGDRGDVGSAGSTTAGLIFGGTPPSPGGSALSEEYNGTSWSEQNNLPAGMWQNSGCGTQTAACSIGGYNGSATNVLNLYDGTCWTTSPATLNTSRYAGFAFGITTAAVYCSGYPPWQGATENFNGTAWTASGELPAPVQGAAGAGTQTAGIGVGGEDSTGLTGVAHFYNGSTWSTSANTVTARMKLGSANAAANTAAMVFGGLAPAVTDATEEFSIPSTISVAQEGQVWYNTTSTVLKGFGLSPALGTWASGGNVNSARKDPASFGASSSASLICVGEQPGGPQKLTETYNGTAWTEVGDTNTARPNAGAGAGTTTAGLCYGGGTNNNESWNGTSWSEIANVNHTGTQAGGLGTQTAAMYVGGSPATADSETWNGTSWAEGGNINTARYGLIGAGSTTAGIVSGGPGVGNGYVETYDGSTWTETTDLNTARFQAMGAQNAPSSAVLVAAGGPPNKTNTELWNGSAWTEVADISYARNQGGGGGTQTAAVISTGDETPGTVVNTEEWAVTINAIKTFTAT